MTRNDPLYLPSGRAGSNSTIGSIHRFDFLPSALE
jgi:hypothetical protein